MKNINSSKGEIEAVKKLLSKLSPEDLEKAAGGISARARNILLVTGALAITGVTSAVLISKYSGKSSVNNANMGRIIDDKIHKKEEVTETLDDKIKRCNVSEKFIEAVGGKEKVFDAWTYYDHPKEEGDKCMGEPELKKGFDLWKKDGRIYHRESQYSWGSFVTGEEGRGVPYNELEW